jgi:triphosphatase
MMAKPRLPQSRSPKRAVRSSKGKTHVGKIAPAKARTALPEAVLAEDSSAVAPQPSAPDAEPLTPDSAPQPSSSHSFDPQSPPPSAEIELKLSISAEEMERLLRHPFLKAAARGRAVTRHLHNVYYDTPEFALRSEKVALRLRRDGAKWMQTLKTAGRVEGGLHMRQEHDAPVPAQLLNYHALAQSGASAVFNDAQLRGSLQPVFVTDFKRSTRDIEAAPGILVELCIDSGSVTAGANTAQIREVELELKTGQPSDLLDFARQLLQQVPMRLEPRSKAERGYALAAHTRQAPSKASPLALHAGMSVTDAFAEVVSSCLHHLQANERGLLESDDEEYLHQARVALRRLRSAFSVFGRALPRRAFEGLLEEVRWLGGCLGPARDWDVFATQSLPTLSTAFPRERGLRWLIEATATRRADANRAAREAVASVRYTTLLLDVVGSLYRQPWTTLDDEAAASERARPPSEFAAAVLTRHHRKVIKSGRDHAELDTTALHAWRIQVKKLRYAADFFSSLYEPKAARAYGAALAGLQELLGSLNDAASVERLCEALRDDPQDASVSEILGLARGWSSATARAYIERLPEAWKRFRQCDPFWKEE